MTSSTYGRGTELIIALCKNHMDEKASSQSTMIADFQLALLIRFSTNKYYIEHKQVKSFRLIYSFLLVGFKQAPKLGANSGQII